MQLIAKSWFLVSRAIFLLVTALLASCSSVDKRGGESTASQSAEVVAPIGGANFTFRMTSITMGRSPQVTLLTFHLTLDGAIVSHDVGEIFECNDPTLSPVLCEDGRVVRIPEDLNGGIGDVLAANNVRHGVFDPSQPSFDLRVTINQDPVSWFGAEQIVIGLHVDVATGQITATNIGATPTTELTSSCVTTSQDWKYCWTLDLPCKSPGQTNVECTVSQPGCLGAPLGPGHAACIGGVPGTCVPDGACPDWDLEPNPLSSGAPTSDDNDLLLNPKWGWQVDGTPPKLFPIPLSPGQTSQPTHHQGEFLCGGSGHTNYTDATYVGPLRWDSHSPPIQDDDYNISILPPLAVGTPFPAGITLGNDRTTFIQTEFDSDETIDHFDSIPWWHDFHLSVDANDDLARSKINDHLGILTGLVGIDEAHDGKSELHPVHIFAVRQSLSPNPNDDAWSIFFRNSGDEGFCGDDQERVNLTTMTLRLPRPTPQQGVPAQATFTFGPATQFGRFLAPDQPVSVSPASNGDTLVTVQLSDPAAEGFIVGELHLVWGPLGAPANASMQAAIAPAPAATADLNDDDPEDRFGAAFAALPLAQRQLALDIYGALVKPQQLDVVPMTVVKVLTPPAPPPLPPTVTLGPETDRRKARVNARVLAICFVTHGNYPDHPEACTGTAATNLPPIVKCQPVQVVANAACQGVLAPPGVDAGSFDPEGQTLTCAQAPSSPYPLGVTSVTDTCSDPAGASNQCVATVTVVDQTKPTIVAPPDITITTCVNANIGRPTVSDNCGTPIVTSDAPAKFSLGTTTVTWKATDGSGNFATARQVVTAVLGDDPSCCPMGTHVILGTSASDHLVGTAGSDCILGRGGDDNIDGGNGDDFISGGDGNDTIAGGPGNDFIFGGAGNDTIASGTGDDFIDGGDGTDTCAGGTGTNAIRRCETTAFCTATCCSTNSCEVPRPPAADTCRSPFAQSNCLSYTTGTVVASGGHNWQCSSGNCANCATFTSCFPGATGCPFGAVWADLGACQ